MSNYDLSRLSDACLLRNLDSIVSRERAATAAGLAHIAEVDARRLYLPTGYPSMYEYCVGRLALSEQSAKKRIRAGRAARRFPTIFEAVAEGRLSLTAVVVLAPYLSPENADELLSASAGHTRSEIEQNLASRFPRLDAPDGLELIVPDARAVRATEQVSPGTPERGQIRDSANLLAAAPGAMTLVEPKVAPISAERFAVQFTIARATRDKLEYARALLSHRLPAGEMERVFERAIDALIRELEKQKFAATSKPRSQVTSARASANPRHIPAEVKRAVWKRDGGQCTFVGENGRRCGSTRFLQFDHIEPVARGGRATAANLRLRCRGHNQFEAERA